MARPNVVMVERDTYDAMVNAFTRVKNERFRNAQVVDKMEKSLDTLGHEIDSLAAKLAETRNFVSSAKESAHSIPEDYGSLKVKLTADVETVEYDLMETEDKAHKLLSSIKNMRLTMKPLKDYKA